MSTPITPEQVQLIKSSFQAVAPRADELVEVFYAKLFARAPQLRPLFPDDMTQQKQHLLGAVKLVVVNIDNIETLEQPLMDMGARHVNYGASPDHYGVVRDTMVDAIASIAGDLWNDDLADAWSDALDVVAQIMIRGGEQAQQRSMAA